MELFGFKKAFLKSLFSVLCSQISSSFRFLETADKFFKFVNLNFKTVFFYTVYRLKTKT